MGTKDNTTDDKELENVEVTAEDFGGSTPEDDDQDLDLGNDIEEPEAEPKSKDKELEPEPESDDDKPDDEESDDEENSDDDSESESSEDSEDDEPETGEDPTQKIPVSRLNKEIEKRRKSEEKFSVLERELQELRAKIDNNGDSQEARDNRKSDDEDVRLQQEEADKKLEEEMNAAFEEMLDGDTGKATNTLMRAIRENRDISAKLAEKASQEVYSQQSSQDRQAQELQQTAEKIVSEYPVLNNQDEERFNPDIFDEVLDLRDAYMSSGMAPAKALEKASTTIMRAYGQKPVTATQEPNPDAESQEQAQKQRKQEALKEKLDKRDKQPPETGGKNDRTQERTSVEEMPEKDFDQLSEEQLRELRGDNV